ncbi:TetR/AcrR family transcriptional regulator [Bacillus salacetis]|uniref:TetR/AcrR family transcriptional regulator n=1 Tax=Bacillus salacetis TaxID=2315464 RepID=A0A3A1QPD1_9BACI|nr:TetR/AcrR family transcriptional regulator [Bacillus salacetis]RIW28924.1 TetR/AcrR family transcriptional regulator [Bacillus salacetis]
MLTANQIKAVSLKHFAQNGYEGASLSHIANDVGIKKQSIYTHFKGKDEIFLELCKDSFQQELADVMEFINRHSAQPIKDLLYGFLKLGIERYEKYDSTRFMIRTAFFPPQHLNAEIMKDVYGYLDRLEEIFFPVIKEAAENGEISSEIEVYQATSAFLGVLDGIYVEMLYGGPERLKKRLDASWYLFWRGLSIH